MKQFIYGAYLLIIVLCAFYCFKKWPQPSKLIYSHTETLVQEQSDFVRNVAKLLEFIHKQGYMCSLGEAWRSKEQAAIYAKEGKGIRDSLHCERLAIDLNIFDETGHYLGDGDEYEMLGTYWESLDERNEWGGRWRPNKQHPHQVVDLDHFEMKVK